MTRAARWAGGMPASTKAKCIPSKLIVPIIRRYLELYQDAIGAEAGSMDNDGAMDYRYEETGSERGDWNKFRFAGAVKVLAAEVGCHYDTLYKHLEGKRTWMEFDLADKLLCKMDRVFDWYEPSLSDYYWTVKL